MQVDQKEGKRQNQREDRRKPKTEGDQVNKDNKNKDTTEDKGQNFNRKDKKDQKPRKPRFEPPANWKEEIEKTITADSKVPSLPADAERLHKPNYNKLRNDLDFCEGEMDKHYKKIDSLKDEQKKIRFELRDKNATLFDELKRLNDERKVHSAALAENKELKKQYNDKINHIDEQLRSVEKKNFQGKLMRKKELMDLIKIKEEEFKNTKKTSAEEKKMNDEITRLKNMIKSIPEFEKLQVERQKYNDLVREINKKNKVEFEKMQKVSDLISEVRVRLDETTLKIKQEKQEEGEGEKKKHTPSVAEQQLESIKQEHYDEIKKLKEKKQKLREKYEQDWTDFEKQQFELDKIHFMQKVQKRLRREEREKKRKEEEEKQKAYEEEKAKELLQFKYQEEINLCESLATLLEDMKPDKKVTKNIIEQKEITHHEVNPDILKQENLVYIKPKKFDDAADTIVNKKKNKQQKNKKKEVKIENPESEKVNIHFDTLNLFNEIKVMPPTTYAQLDTVINQLNEKRDYYIKLREKEIEEAGNVKEGEGKEGEEGEGETPEVQEEKPRESKPARQQKAVELKEEDFPEL